MPSVLTPLSLQRLPPSIRRCYCQGRKRSRPLRPPSRGERGEQGSIWDALQQQEERETGEKARQQAGSSRSSRPQPGGPRVLAPRLAQSLQATQLPHRGRQCPPHTEGPGEAQGQGRERAPSTSGVTARGAPVEAGLGPPHNPEAACTSAQCGWCKQNHSTYFPGTGSLVLGTQCGTQTPNSSGRDLHVCEILPTCELLHQGCGF